MSFGTVTHVGPVQQSTVKISNFWKSKMTAAAILKNHKNHDISATVWPIFTKFGNLMQNGSLNRSTVKKFEFHKSKMADICHSENRKIAISMQPYDRFWWNLAQWHILAPYRGIVRKITIFWKSNMAAAPCWKSQKSRYLRNGLPIFTKSGTLMRNGFLNLSNKISSYSANQGGS